MSTETNRKVFISFLGASNYKECQYVIDSEASRPVRYVQEAMLDYYSRHGWTSHDCAYILLTNVAQDRNWENDGQKDDNGNIIKQLGLRDSLAALELPMSIVPVENVPMGNDEKEIMSIFSLIFGMLEDGDELYFDITHGFRYLPMITLVLGNYSKFLKNVTVRWIGYGNFEGRNQATNIAQVVDLTSMSMLQDWTTAAADFINNGNAASLTSRTKETLAPILLDERGDNKTALAMDKMANALEAMVNDIKNCRGYEIIKAKNVKKLVRNLNSIENNLIEPLMPVLEKIKDSINTFDVIADENISNGFAAALWCINNNMNQQAATILQETAITWVCMRNKLDHSILKDRQIASDAINVLDKDIADWRVKEENLPIVKRIIECEPLLQNNNFVKCYRDLTNLRNDINHCGMLKGRMGTNRIKQNVVVYYENLYNILKDNS